MRAVPALVASLALLLLATVDSTKTALASVTVNFAGGRYADSKINDASVRGSIRSHLQRLGARYVGRDERLAITVLDIDLAGHDLSSTGPSRLRLYTGATTPKIRIRYRLKRGGRVIASGEDMVTDQLYLSRPAAVVSSDELKHEKAMLDDWFREKFSAGRNRAR